MLNLFSIKQQQRTRETLWAYIRRFNRTALEISSATPEILIGAFLQGLSEGDFFRSLKKKSPSSYDTLLGRAAKYIHVEEAQQSRKGEGDLMTSPQPEKKMSRLLDSWCRNLSLIKHMSKKKEGPDTWWCIKRKSAVFGGSNVREVEVLIPQYMTFWL